VTEALSSTPWLIGVVTALVAFFALDLWRLIAEAQSRVDAHDRRMRLGAAGVVGAWVALALFATFVPGVRDSITSVPGLPAILLAALVGGVASLGFAPTFRRAFGAVPMESIMTLFYWRAIFGVWLLAGFAAGRLPAGFGLPAAVGDIAVTLLAIVILAVWPATGGVPRWPLMAWNAVGFFDLVSVAVLAATVLRPWAAQRGLPGANFGLQLFVVPVFLGLHLHIFARLWREMKAQRGSATASAVVAAQNRA
jgi:hypothetical protein